MRRRLRADSPACLAYLEGSMLKKIKNIPVTNWFIYNDIMTKTYKGVWDFIREPETFVII